MKSGRSHGQGTVRSARLPFPLSAGLAHNSSMSGRELALQVSRRLREQGFQALFVGGCVRDLVLGREPVDFDVATDATPDQVLALFPYSLSVGAHFGVVVVYYVEHIADVATYRNIGWYAY